MKKTMILLLALALCLTCLNGCQYVLGTENDGEFQNDFSKTQQIVISDTTSGEVLASLTSKDEIDTFCEKLNSSNCWALTDTENVPPDSERECTFVLAQTETIRAGMDPDDAKMIDLCTLYTYRNSSCLTMEFPFATFPFTLSDTAAGYLHSFAP